MNSTQKEAQLDMFAQRAPTQYPLATTYWLDNCLIKGRSRVHSETVWITPEVARYLLSHNPDNRTLSPVKIRHYTKSMVTGQWPLNGENIIVASDGCLNDGQNRMSALIAADMNLLCVVTFGVERETRLTVDQGSARTAGAYLQMAGHNNGNALAAVAKHILTYEDTGGRNLNGKKVTSGEVFDRAHNEVAITTAMTRAYSQRKVTFAYAAPSLFGLCEYLFRVIDPTDAATYMDQLYKGVGLTEKSPALAVRTRLLALGTDHHNAIPGLKVEAIIRGWNAFRQKRPLTVIKLMGGDLPEPV